MAEPRSKKIKCETICFICQDSSDIVGHTTSTCPYVECKNCGQRGHTKRNCDALIKLQQQCVEQCRLFGLICDKCQVYKAICSTSDSIIINRLTPITFTLPQDVNSETVIVEPQNGESWGIIIEKSHVPVSMSHEIVVNFAATSPRKIQPDLLSTLFYCKVPRIEDHPNKLKVCRNYILEPTEEMVLTLKLPEESSLENTVNVFPQNATLIVVKQKPLLIYSNHGQKCVQVKLRNSSEDTAICFKTDEIIGHAEEYILPFVFIEVHEPTNIFILKYSNGNQSSQSVNSSADDILNEILDNLSFPSEILFMVKYYKDVSTIAKKLFSNSDEEERSSMKTWFYILTVQQRLLSFDSLSSKIMHDGLEKYKMINTQKYLNGELLLDPTMDIVFIELQAIGDAEQIEDCMMITFINYATCSKASGVKTYFESIIEEESSLLSNLQKLGVNHVLSAASHSALIELLAHRLGGLKYIKLPPPTQEIKDSRDAVTLQSQINLNPPIRIYKTSSIPSTISSIKAIQPGTSYWIHSSWTRQVNRLNGTQLKPSGEEDKLYPLQLDESKDIELDPERRPIGPIKIKMPNSNETFKVIQTLAEVNVFGQVAQKVVHSDWKGNTYISLKAKTTEDTVGRIDKRAVIAQLRICSIERTGRCHYEHHFHAMSKFYVKPHFTFWVPLKAYSLSSRKNSPCDKGCHLITVTASLVKELKVMKAKWFMFQDHQVIFPLTNVTSKNIVIEPGRKILKTRCCHEYFD